MFGLTSQQAFIAGIAALWVFSAAVGALPAPEAGSGVFYRWAYAFLKTLAGDLGTAFGKYLPQAAKSGAVAALCALLIVLPMSGCTTSASQLRADGTVLVTALNNLAAAVQVQDPATASKLAEAAQAIQAAVNSGATGAAWQQALNAGSAAAEVILAAIPSTSAYAPLVAIAVAATEAIIANTKPVNTSARYFTAEQRTNLLVFQTQGHYLIKHRPLRSVRGDYVAAWNATAKSVHLPSAAIR